MSQLLSMTFHESYGMIPKRLLTLYRRHNVSPSDHDRILAAFNWTWDSPNIVWQSVLDFVLENVENGYFQLPIYM
jgi:hypothetical protein